MSFTRSKEWKFIHDLNGIFINVIDKPEDWKSVLDTLDEVRSKIMQTYKTEKCVHKELSNMATDVLFGEGKFDY